MDNPTPSLAAETQALRETYAALNRNDIPSTLHAFDPHIEWIEPAGYSEGAYHGHAAVQAHLSQARATWAEGSCEPERFVISADKIVVFLHVRVRLKHHTERIDGRHAAGYTFRNGKGTHMRIFDDPQQALDWAAANPSDAT